MVPVILDGLDITVAFSITAYHGQRIRDMLHTSFPLCFHQFKSFTPFGILPSITVSHVLRAIKLLHVSPCETATCGWKLTPDSWSVSQQSRTSDPHTFINTVCVYDDLKCQVRPSQTAACLLSDPSVATATPPCTDSKLTIRMITVRFTFKVRLDTVASRCRKKGCQMRVYWRVKSIWDDDLGFRQNLDETHTKLEG